jgi:hypothetical protein
LDAQHIENEYRQSVSDRGEQEHLSQRASQVQREQQAEAEALRREVEDIERAEAAAINQARDAEIAERLAQEEEEAAAQEELEAIAQAQIEAEAITQAEAEQAAAQAGQLDQYCEALRQQNLPPGRKGYQEPAGRHSLGPMNVECPHCHALHWDKEKLTASLNNIKFGQCCLQGQIQLPPFPEPPPTLKNLLCGISPFSNTFREHICQYNAAFAFTSLGVKIYHRVTGTTGPYSFKINGELHHLSKALLPEPDEAPALPSSIFMILWRQQESEGIAIKISTPLS